MGVQPIIAVVTRETRMAGLRARWGTTKQAAFVLGQAHIVEEAQAQQRGRKRARAAAPEALDAAEFVEYQREDSFYHRTLKRIVTNLDFGLPVKMLDRGMVPSFDFWNCAVVVVVGQDGLVANTAKYVGELPILGVNPDAARNDGVLLPFRADQVSLAVDRVLHGKYRARNVTLAEVTLNDSQRLLAFNDFFIGAASHVSARYTLDIQGRVESQSSSGILVSTGAGSTGWMSSVFNMTHGVARMVGNSADGDVKLPWEDRRLIWVVREPFRSRHSESNLIAGLLPDGEEIVAESLMPAGGVIFSDGIESDFLQFNTGSIARICASKKSARLVVP
jgi:hypothetical protein